VLEVLLYSGRANGLCHEGLPKLRPESLLKRISVWPASGRLVASLLVVQVAGGCMASLGKYRGVEVKQGGSIQERMALAQAFVADDRLGWLRGRLKSQFSRLTPSDLEAVYLTTTAIGDLGASRADAKAYVIVGVKGLKFRVEDADEVLNLAAREIGAALTEFAPESEQSGKHGLESALEVARPSRV